MHLRWAKEKGYFKTTNSFHPVKESQSGDRRKCPATGTPSPTLPCHSGPLSSSRRNSTQLLPHDPFHIRVDTGSPSPGKGATATPASGPQSTRPKEAPAGPSSTTLQATCPGPHYTCHHGKDSPDQIKTHTV